MLTLRKAFFSFNITKTMFKYVAKFVNENLSLDKAKELQDVIEVSGKIVLVEYIQKNLKEFLPESKFGGFIQKNDSLIINTSGEITVFSSNSFREYLMNIGFPDYLIKSFELFVDITAKIIADDSITIPKIVLLLSVFFEEFIDFRISSEMTFLFNQTKIDFANTIWDLLIEDDRQLIKKVVMEILSNKVSTETKNLSLFKRLNDNSDELKDFYLNLNKELTEAEKSSRLMEHYLPLILNIEEFMVQNQVEANILIEFYSFDSGLREKSKPYVFDQKNEQKLLDRIRNKYRANIYGITTKKENLKKKHATAFTQSLIKYIESYFKYPKKKRE